MLTVNGLRLRFMDKGLGAGLGLSSGIRLRFTLKGLGVGSWLMVWA